MTKDRIYDSSIGVRKSVVKKLDSLSEMFGENKGDIVEKLVDALHKAYKSAVKREVSKLVKEGKENHIFNTRFVWDIEPVSKRIIVGPDVRKFVSKSVGMNDPEIDYEKDLFGEKE